MNEIVKTEIVKCQSPIATNGMNEWLIYDKARKHQTLVPESIIPRRIKDAMMMANKAYFKGTWSQGGWVLGGRVENQNW
jgi:serine protease inhibitor